MPVDEIYEGLGQYFDIEMTYYPNCIRFNQADVFVYLHSES